MDEVLTLNIFLAFNAMEMGKFHTFYAHAYNSLDFNHFQADRVSSFNFAFKLPKNKRHLKSLIK